MQIRIAQLVDKYVPSKTLSTHYRVPWFTNVIKRLSRKKKRLYTGATKSHGKLRETLWSRYKTCKAEFNKGMKQAKEQFVNIISNAFHDNDTKPFWKFVRAKRCDNNGIAPLKTNGCLYSDSQSKADILNHQFSSVFTRENTTDIPLLPGDSYPSMSDIVVEPYGVEKLLSKVKPSKASGPDAIPCLVLKVTAHEIAPILADIFNCSLSTGILPRD